MSLSQITWNLPWVLLLIIPYAFYIYYLYHHKNIKPTFQIGSISYLKKWSNRGLAQLSQLNDFLIYFSVLLLIVALARPQQANSKSKRTMDGLDIVIVLDVSDSMLIEDMKPFNRLESAKETISQFIKLRTSDRIGVVIFAGEAFTLVPPTLDYDLILKRIEKIKTAAEARIKDGTAIGVAMAAGAARLKDSQAKSRVMIFLTDGENNSGMISPETGLDIAKGYGIKIYSIGIGKDGKTQLPIYTTDMFGNKTKRYQNFESTVNEELLGQMAEVTGGKFYRANKENSLEGVFSEINKLETTKIEETKYVQYTEYFKFFLIPGLLLFLICKILSLTLLRRGPA
jgi:Ca-activated chloride channel family protein